MKFRKKPVVVEATQWKAHGDHPLVTRMLQGPTPCPQCRSSIDQHGTIDTLEGDHRVCPGDWIISGVNGELYPCKPDVFEKTYDRVEEP